MKRPKRYYCGIGEGMFGDDKNGNWIEYSEHKTIVEELKQALRIHNAKVRSEHLISFLHQYQKTCEVMHVNKIDAKDFVALYKTNAPRYK